jgi:transcription antitermination factor NusA-like protein
VFGGQRCPNGTRARVAVLFATAGSSETGAGVGVNSVRVAALWDVLEPSSTRVCAVRLSDPVELAADACSGTCVGARSARVALDVAAAVLSGIVDSDVMTVRVAADCAVLAPRGM